VIKYCTTLYKDVLGILPYGSSLYRDDFNDVDIAVIVDKIYRRFKVIGITVDIPTDLHQEKYGLFHLLFVTEKGLDGKFKDGKSIRKEINAFEFR